LVALVLYLPSEVPAEGAERDASSSGVWCVGRVPPLTVERASSCNTTACPHITEQERKTTLEKTRAGQWVALLFMQKPTPSIRITSAMRGA
jgi:hypothetical protein